MALSLDGYVRVSRVAGREGESFISPDVQREQIAAWARLRGVTIAAWHEDLDVSGGTFKRPGLDALLARVRAGATGGIAVARLDRLSRAGVGDALRVVDEIHEAGGRIAAVDLGIDPTTPFGEFAMTIMLALGRMERRRITEQWRVSRQRAVARGVHVASARPTGYRRGPDGRLVPDEHDGPRIAELFARRAAGESWTALAAYLNDRGVQGPYNTVWVAGAVPHLIGNRVYLGEARSGEFRNADAHVPLVDRRLWEAAQNARSPTPARSEHPALLSGLLRCAGCSHTMKPDRVRMGDGRYERTYRCRGTRATGVCGDRAAAMGHIVEEYVQREVLEHLAVTADAMDADDELATAQEMAQAAEDSLAAYRDDERISTALGVDRYVEGLTRRAQAADEAWEAVASLQGRQGGTDTAELAAMWPLMDVSERRLALTAMLDCVFLRSGRMLPIDERVWICLRGEGPADLPRRGLRRPPIPFAWPDRPA